MIFDSVEWSVMDRIRDGLRGLTFSGIDGWPGINIDNIVIRPDRLQEYDQNEEWKDEDLPGIIISSGGSTAPAELGTNVRDDVFYRVLCQVIDRCEDRVHEPALRSHSLWCQQIRRSIHGNPWDNKDVFGGDSYINISWSKVVNSVDRTLYWKHKFFSRGVDTEFRAREPRDSMVI